MRYKCCIKWRHFCILTFRKWNSKKPNHKSLWDGKPRLRAETQMSMWAYPDAECFLVIGRHCGVQARVPTLGTSGLPKLMKEIGLPLLQSDW